MPFGERLIAYLPRYAPVARRLGPLLNLRDRVPGAALLSERWLGLSAKRRLPRWRRDAFPAEAGLGGGGTAVKWSCFVDTFNRYFEPENARAALQGAAGGRLSRTLARGAWTADRCAAGARFCTAAW